VATQDHESLQTDVAGGHVEHPVDAERVDRLCALARRADRDVVADVEVATRSGRTGDGEHVRAGHGQLDDVGPGIARGAGHVRVPGVGAQHRLAQAALQVGPDRTVEVRVDVDRRRACRRGEREAQQRQRRGPHAAGWL
jgi:hypothetical protein